MQTMLNIRTRRRVNGRIVTVCATISVETTGPSPVMEGDGPEGGCDDGPFESLIFEDRIACLNDIEEALIDSLEPYI
jgi:hypothetical protein